MEIEMRKICGKYLECSISGTGGSLETGTMDIEDCVQLAEGMLQAVSYIATFCKFDKVEKLADLSSELLHIQHHLNRETK